MYTYNLLRVDLRPHTHTLTEPRSTTRTGGSFIKEAHGLQTLGGLGIPYRAKVYMVRCSLG